MKIKSLIRSSIAYPFTGRIMRVTCARNKGVNALLHADDTLEPSRKRLGYWCSFHHRIICLIFISDYYEPTSACIPIRAAYKHGSSFRRTGVRFPSRAGYRSHITNSGSDLCRLMRALRKRWRLRDEKLVLWSRKHTNTMENVSSQLPKLVRADRFYKDDP